MDVENIKRMLDACYQAKRIRDMLPPLPGGVTPSYIHFLDKVQQLSARGERVRVSDISDALNLPRPGVTRMLKEMEAKDYLKKIASDDDGRVTYVTITDAGAELSDKYNRKYFETLAGYLGDISDADVECVIRTIEKFYRVMCERRTDIG